MSGGHWDYLGSRLEERANYAGNVWTLMAAIERSLDWGISADTCLDCARLRVAHGLEAYFDTEATNETSAIRLIRSTEPECEACKKWEQEHRKKPRPSATVEYEVGGKMYRGTVYQVEGDE